MTLKSLCPIEQLGCQVWRAHRQALPYTHPSMELMEDGLLMRQKQRLSSVLTKRAAFVDEPLKIQNDRAFQW